MKDVVRTILKVLLPLIAIALGVGVFISLVRTKPSAERTERPDRAPLVEVTTAVAGSHDMTVEAQGEVVPARRVVLQPELTGRVVWQSDELVPGGRFRQGETILRIDPRDYRVAVEQQAAQVDRARTDLELERGRQVVAQREWELFGGEPPAERPAAEGDGSEEEEPANLALREPQVRTARVAVKAAESALDRARLNLRRTTVEAPFNAMVQSESVDRGQLVSPQTQVATLVGTDTFWVQVSVPLEVIGHIQVPGVSGTEGSEVRVLQEVGERRVERTGRVERLLGDLDPVGRMARLLVAIDNPLALEEAVEGQEDRLPLLLGAFVRVFIDGGQLDDVIGVPREALREGSKLYVMNGDDQLEIREARIVWRTEEEVFVRSGEALRPGDRVIVSRVPTPVEGMELRIDEGPTVDEGAESAPRAEAETP